MSATKEASAVKHFTGSYAEFEKLLTAQADKKLVVVDFFATCEALAGVHKDVLFVKVDVDESEEVATKLDISAMPTFMFFKAGKRVHIFKGANEAELTTSVTAHK